MIILRSTHEQIVSDLKRAISMKEQEVALLKDTVHEMTLALAERSPQQPPEGKPIAGLRSWKNAKSNFIARDRLRASTTEGKRANDRSESNEDSGNSAT